MTQQQIKEQINILQLSIEELRRTHDEIAELYRQIRIRVLTYMGGGFALFSFLYADAGTNDSNIMDALFIPKEQLSLATSLLIIAAILLLVINNFT